LTENLADVVHFDMCCQGESIPLEPISIGWLGFISGSCLNPIHTWQVTGLTNGLTYDIQLSPSYLPQPTGFNSLGQLQLDFNAILLPGMEVTYTLAITVSNGCESAVYQVQETYRKPLPSECPPIRSGQESNGLFSLSPNPASQFIYLQYPELQTAQVSIFHTDGKRIMQTKLPAHAQELRLSLAELPKGMYLLQVHDETHTYHLEKFLIQ